MFLYQLSCFCKIIINVFNKFLLFVDRSVLDTSQVSDDHLVVQAEDLGNRSLGYCALATVEIAIVRNTQVAPRYHFPSRTPECELSSGHFPGNSGGPDFQNNSTQMRWDSPAIFYLLWVIPLD